MLNIPHLSDRFSEEVMCKRGDPTRAHGFHG
jgi:hypothetical protein